MTREPIVAVALLTQRQVNCFGDALRKVYRVDETPCFGDLLAAIDEADREYRRERDRQGTGTPSDTLVAPLSRKGR